MKNFYIAVTAGLLLAGCGQKSTEQADPVAVTSTKIAVQNADDVAKLLQDAGIEITDITAVTAADDSNQLLGRPGQYSSKLFFYDRRHPKVEGTDEHENTIEVFSSAEDAKTRHDYIDSVTKGVPMLLQYMILRGNVLVRLDKAILPDEAKAYEDALSKIE